MDIDIEIVAKYLESNGIITSIVVWGKRWDRAYVTARLRKSIESIEVQVWPRPEHLACRLPNISSPTYIEELKRFIKTCSEQTNCNDCEYFEDYS